MLCQPQIYFLKGCPPPSPTHTLSYVYCLVRKRKIPYTLAGLFSPKRAHLKDLIILRCLINAILDFDDPIVGTHEYAQSFPASSWHACLQFIQCIIARSIDALVCARVVWNEQRRVKHVRHILLANKGCLVLSYRVCTQETMALTTNVVEHKALRSLCQGLIEQCCMLQSTRTALVDVGVFQEDTKYILISQYWVYFC